jgi:uncharacterized protein YfkK (UPF0435 family)
MAYITYGDEKFNIKQFIDKIMNYDIELTRQDIINVIKTAESFSPSDVPVILDTVKHAYHINMA